MTNLFTKLFAIALLAQGQAFAAGSGTLNISGTVALVNDIVVTANGSNNSTLNITGGETGKNVANVAETSNDATGYTISLASANGGELRLAADATKKALYQISYNGGSYATPSVAGATVKTVSSLPGLTTNNSAVLVKVTANPTAPAGVYSDTITLTIIANP